MRKYIDIVNRLNEAWNPVLTAKNYGEKLKAKMLTDSSLKSQGLIADNGAIYRLDSYMSSAATQSIGLEDIINLFASYDPTKKKFYLLNWIIPKYLSGGIARLEDLAGVKEDLTKYHEYKHLMANQDIKLIPNASALSQVVRDVMKTMNAGGLLVPKAEADAARQESLLITENENFIVVIPLTQRAAGYWGRYSQWCTAYGYQYGVNNTKTSYFNSYDGKGTHLLIFFDKKAKYDSDGSLEDGDQDDSIQCWYSEDGDERQLADIDDNPSDNLQEYFKIIPKDKRQLVVEQCLGGFVYKDGSICRSGENIKELVEKYGNDVAHNAARSLLDGDHRDFVDGYSDLETCLDGFPKKIRKLIDAYVKKKYPDEFEEETTSSILEEHEDEEEKLIELIKIDDMNARQWGAEKEMFEYFEMALKNAGMEYETLDQSPVFLLLDSFVDFMSNTEEKELDSNIIKMKEPYYGFSGYDENAFEDGELVDFLEKHVGEEEETV